MRGFAVPDCPNPEAALSFIRELITDLELRLQTVSSDRERQALTNVLNCRRLEEADLRDQILESGDLP
jgi:hypothetical protein